MKKTFFAFLLLSFIVLLSGVAFSQTYSGTLDYNIVAPADFDLNSEFTFSIDLNSEITSQLTDNVDFNDISPYYNDTPLQRKVEKNGANARVYIRIPMGLTILKGGFDNNFMIKYGSDVNISAPLINDSNIFQRWFDFNGASIPPNLISSNASIHDGAIKLVDGVVSGDSYFFINDLNFNTIWGLTFEADVNLGPLGGGSFGFNDNSATTEASMIYSMYEKANLGTINIAVDVNSFPGINPYDFYRLKVIPKSGIAGAFFVHNLLSTFDYNYFHQSYVSSQQIVRAGVSVQADNGTSVEYDNVKVYYDVNWAGGQVKLSSVDTNRLQISINASPSIGVLDSDSGIDSVIVDFNSVVSKSTNLTITDYNWFIDSVPIVSTQNMQYSFTLVGDYNVSLIVDANSGIFRSQSDLNFLVRNAPQGIDINYSFDTNTSHLDVNYGVTSSGIINYVVWGFPHDQNQTGLVSTKSYTDGNSREICVVVNGVGDVNKLTCETFYDTWVVSKIPLDITNFIFLTPFDVTVSINPIQNYSGVSSDQNFWFFYQSPDFKQYNFTIDANLSYYVSNYLVSVSDSDFNQSIQPYMVPVTDGISVVFTSKDSLTNDILPGSFLYFSRTVSGVGNIVVISGMTDSVGRINFPFIPDIDHNFTVEYPFGTIIKTGNYRPVSSDTTNGISVIVPSSTIGADENVTGYLDVNFLQETVSVKANNTVDLNDVVSSSRAISSITITVDYNGTNLYSDTNSGSVDSGGVFGQNVDVSGLDTTLPLVVSVIVSFANGQQVLVSKAIGISRNYSLFNVFAGGVSDLGGVGGSMILVAFILAILLGVVHYAFPIASESQHTFLLAAAILAFLSIVGWVDGVSWVIGCLAGGAAYVLRRVPQ